MKSRHRYFFLALSLTLAVLGCNGADGPGAHQTTGPAISGRIEAGLRVLTVDPSAAEAPHFTIYRGDYVRLESRNGQPVTIVVPDLDVDKTYPVADDEKAYFKVPNAGRFAYTLGDLSGVIEALEYAASGYREVSAEEAAVLIRSTEPLILDVRTPGEFAQGHLPGAKLIPVQVLEAQIAQLGDDKDQPLFIYCRSGNRSTVAAKLLMDRGFTNVVNLRRGIGEWQAEDLPIVK
jgi:rhodanese-related sulfurtransferase